VGNEDFRKIFGSFSSSAKRKVGRTKVELSDYRDAESTEVDVSLRILNESVQVSEAFALQRQIKTYLYFHHTDLCNPDSNYK